MSHLAFMDAVRQYASLAQRKHVSYAEQVHQLAQMRANEITVKETDAAKRTKLLSDLQGFLAREYQPWDKEFAVRSYD